MNSRLRGITGGTIPGPLPSPFLYNAFGKSIESEKWSIYVCNY